MFKRHFRDMYNSYTFSLYAIYVLIILIGKEEDCVFFSDTMKQTNDLIHMDICWEKSTNATKPKVILKHFELSDADQKRNKK